MIYFVTYIFFNRQTFFVQQVEKPNYEKYMKAFKRVNIQQPAYL